MNFFRRLIVFCAVSYGQVPDGFSNGTGDITLGSQQSKYMSLVQPPAPARELVVLVVRARCEKNPLRIEQGQGQVINPVRLLANELNPIQLKIPTATGELYKADQVATWSLFNFVDAGARAGNVDFPVVNWPMDRTPGRAFTIRMINRGPDSDTCRMVLYWTEKPQ